MSRLAILDRPFDKVHSYCPPFNYLTNNSFDSAVNGYLIHECNVHPPSSSQYSLAVYYNAEFFSTIAYPAVAEVGVRVTKLGNSSVAFEVCLFEDGVIEPKAVGEYTHVFVERSTGRPAKTGMTDSLREGLQRIQKQLDSSRL